jgi:hypothetical protein
MVDNFNVEQDKKDELRQEWEQDQLMEEARERAEQPMNDWIGDNIKDLRREFCEDNEDAFRDYCKEAWRQNE